jgi:hypothetical protein
MNLLETVRKICERLAPLGWARLLARHDLRLNTHTLQNSRRLAAELGRRIKIDRSVPGFEDFWPDGNRAIEPGRPSRSLLYHALASPLVHPESDETPGPDAYPTLLELDAIENYIYGKRNKPLGYFLKKKEGSRLVVGVFAYQYRIGARSPNGKFASTALSRTGISRVGTADYSYDPIRRSFWPCPDAGRDRIGVMPARYAAYLAEERAPEADDAIQGEQPGDEDRNFLFPIHKLFDGDECLRNATVHVDFLERHRNEKLKTFHTATGVPVIEGFDIRQSPFVRDSNSGDPLVTLERVGSSILVVPAWHTRLTRVAFAQNNKTGKKEIARFVVPKKAGDNRYAGTSFQYLDPKFAERRTGPEYANIRHLVVDPLDASQVVDLNKTLPWKRFKRTVSAGGYEAAHFVDDSCEGCVTAKVTGIDLGQEAGTNFPAFSIVSAPDFFPLVDQADIADWVQQVLGPGGEREQFAQGGPRPMSERRNCVNPDLLRPDAPCAGAFPVRDDGFARVETITALVGGKSLGGSEPPPMKDRRFADPSTSFLPDSASGIFDPGWDTSFSGNEEADFLAAFGLGSPFPEDVKLCAALNSFWPSAAPDATRTFGLFPSDDLDASDNLDATTSIPLMDIELGLHPRHPAVQARRHRSHTGWDGEYGPFLERGAKMVNHAHIDQSDYVSNALAGKISVRPLSKIDAPEVFRRMNAIRDAIAVLPVKPRRVSATPLVLISAESVEEWEARPDQGDRRLKGCGFLFVFALLNRKDKGKPAQERGRWVRKVDRRYSCQISQSGICWKLETKGEPFTFVTRRAT